MAMVKEVIKLKDGREVIMNLSEDELAYLLSFAVNNLLRAGVVAISEDEVASLSETVAQEAAAEKETLH